MNDKDFCPVCMGTGKIYKIKGNLMDAETSPCPECSGFPWGKAIIATAVIIGILYFILK